MRGKVAEGRMRVELVWYPVQKCYGKRAPHQSASRTASPEGEAFKEVL